MLNSAFLLLHLLTMFTIIALHSGPQILAYAAARTGQPAAVAGIANMYGRTGRAVPPLGILGALFGIATALVYGLNLLAPWLLIAYALFGALVVYGGVVSVPYVARVGRAAGDGGPAYEALIGRRLTVVIVIDALIYVLIIADMVIKPFGL